MLLLQGAGGAVWRWLDFLRTTAARRPAALGAPISGLPRSHNGGMGPWHAQPAATLGLSPTPKRTQATRQYEVKCIRGENNNKF